MEPTPRKIVTLTLNNGKNPFREWRNKIKDKTLGAAIDARLVRIRTGNFGDHKSLGDDVYELRVPKGPGIRIYYALKGTELVILLGGGDKSSQNKDIETAKKLWKEYKNET